MSKLGGQGGGKVNLKKTRGGYRGGTVSREKGNKSCGKEKGPLCRGGNESE